MIFESFYIVVFRKIAALIRLMRDLFFYYCLEYDDVIC